MQFNHELIVPNEDLPFKLFIFEGKDGNYEREKHWHRSVEIFAVCEGELSFYIGEESYPLSKGEFMIVNSNEVHSVHAPKCNQTVVLQIPIRLFENYFTGEQFIWFTHNPRERDEKLMGLIQEMYEVYQEKECGYDMQVKGLFYLIMHLLISEYQKTDVTEEQLQRNKNLNRLSGITSYIKENYDSDLSLEELAKIFGYSPTYLSRMFQKYAGITFKSYLQDIRLRYAWQELKNSDTTLSEIALRHGFPNSKALARAFRKRYGILPSTYREQEKRRRTEKTEKDKKLT